MSWWGIYRRTADSISWKGQNDRVVLRLLDFPLREEAVDRLLVTGKFQPRVSH